MNFTQHTIGTTPLHLISTDKFKNVHIAVRFFDTLDKRRATVRHLLVSMMKSKTRVHPTRKAFSRHLETLYDTMLHGTSSKFGILHINQIDIGMINPALLSEWGLMDDVIDALAQVLYEPVLDEVTLKEEKQFLRDFFASEYSNKTRYATKRYFDHLFEDHPYNVHPFGATSVIDSITLDDIREEHRRMLADDAALVSVVGNIDADLLKATISEKLVLPSSPLPKEVFSRASIKAQGEVNETMDVTQARLFMTLKSGVFYSDDDYATMMVFNALFGDNAESMLFQIIREQHGLAYYAHSSYAPSSGLITVNAGVDETNVEKTKAIVRDILRDIQHGTFDDAQLSLAKTTLTASLKKSFDSLRSLSNKALRHAIFGVPFEKETMMQAIQTVSREDVVRAANRLELIFNYVLRGQDNEA